MGLGMVLVVAPEDVDAVTGGAGGAVRVGTVVAGAPFEIV